MLCRKKNHKLLKEIAEDAIDELQWNRAIPFDSSRGFLNFLVMYNIYHFFHDTLFLRILRWQLLNNIKRLICWRYYLNIYET